VFSKLKNTKKKSYYLTIVTVLLYYLSGVLLPMIPHIMLYERNRSHNVYSFPNQQCCTRMSVNSQAGTHTGVE
jgi:hypothetical protein